MGNGTAQLSIDGLELATAHSPLGGVSSLDLGRLFTRAASLYVTLTLDCTTAEPMPPGEQCGRDGEADGRR
jgi:hypothetical protein